MADTLTTLAAYSIAAEKALFAYPDWTAIGSENNATTTATATALTGPNRQRCALWAIVSFNGTPGTAITFQVKDGSTVIFQIGLAASTTAPVVIPLRGLRSSPGAALSATMSASGTGGVTGTISLAGVDLRAP